MKITKKTALGIGITAAAAAVLVINMLIQSGTVAGYPMEEPVLRAVQGIIIRGGLVNLVLVLGGIVYFILAAASNTRKADTVKKLARRLSAGSFNEPIVMDEKEHDPVISDLSTALSRYAELSGTADRFAAEMRELQTILKDENSERTAAAAAISQNIALTTERFSELDTIITQTEESLGAIKNHLELFRDKTGRQSSAMEYAGNALEETCSGADTIALRLGRNAQKAEELEQGILAGEEQVQNANDILKSISKDVEKITEITEIINQISEQTNILSMNAAIESAHAGAAGAGFAVVADEIRKLADSTRENAQRIHEEVTALTKKIKEAMASSDDSFRSFSSITGEVRQFTKEVYDLSALALENKEKNRQIDTSVSDSLEIARSIRDGTAEILIHYQTFHSSIEQVRQLSQGTRNGIREIQSGTLEILEKTEGLEQKAAESLGRTEKIKTDSRNRPGTAEKTAAPPSGGSRIPPAAAGVPAREPESAPRRKTELFTLRAPTEEERAAGKAPEDVVIPAAQPLRESAAAAASSQKTPASAEPTPAADRSAQSREEVPEDDDIYYDERGVAVKRPPITIP
ncbi:methyl-accepting chemotaxis protein [Breznakiella homolactica]|uniref:Methyl-accepting transducer domain-containing protein n=1 Tax=Breznakiella homolactica TaxID=2798577 RepID=A0A7T8B9R0_9SPIR|nr:methyl-accepting chemotaxis protein [Breznakiella homolactica]QQO08571.1 hypothetical protein JFL75_16785 [Breznakiella homolactica]